MSAIVYQDSLITLIHGDFREHEYDTQIGMVVADPPYGQTALVWDRWISGWVDDVARIAPEDASMWCFGSLRMFMDHAADFADAGWKIAQDVVWEKHNGSSFAKDRFRRVHEQACQFYRGKWGSVYKDTPVTMDAKARVVYRNNQPKHTGKIGQVSYASVDGGPRLARSVIRERSCHHYAIHPTQKPVGIVSPLIQCSGDPSRVVFVPFAGSGTELLAGAMLGRRCVGYEVREEYAAAAAARIKSERSQRSLLSSP